MHIWAVCNTFGWPIVDDTSGLVPLHKLPSLCLDIYAISKHKPAGTLQNDRDRPTGSSLVTEQFFPEVFPSHSSRPRVVCKLEGFAARVEARGPQGIIISPLLQHVTQPGKASDSPNVFASSDHVGTAGPFSTSRFHHAVLKGGNFRSVSARLQCEY